MIAYQPKGGMCCNCINKHKDCSHLPFNTYPVIEKWGKILIVACKEYKKHD